MIELADKSDIHKLLRGAEFLRAGGESVSDKGSYTSDLYCAVCEQVTQMRTVVNPNAWTDMRGAFQCASCGLNNRDRLFVKSVKSLECATDVRALIFERFSPLYAALRKLIPSLEGVEFGGDGLESGTEATSRHGKFIHQNMCDMSYPNDHFELIMHSDVLEHIPNPQKAMMEIHRTLAPSGICLFSTPIYTGVNEHREIAKLIDGEVKFVEQEVYHGDPLTGRGIAVFYEFGFDLLEELRDIGFKAAALIDHSILEGVTSNNNPYVNYGHMWPIVIKAQKE